MGEGGGGSVSLIYLFSLISNLFSLISSYYTHVIMATTIYRDQRRSDKRAPLIFGSFFLHFTPTLPYKFVH